MRVGHPRLPVAVALIALLMGTAAYAQSPVTYRVAFPAPEHHYAQIDVTFSNLPSGRLQARMSRSSPGRYAVHEFSKNVFEVRAFDGKGKELVAAHPNPYEWDVDGHDGTVRIVYKIYGDYVDGTYLAIDTTHAHMNMPATFMWARGLDNRPIRVTFEPPKGLAWTPATQLYPTNDQWTFTAPNLQYFMDSPTELSAQVIKTFKVTAADGKEATIRVALHHDAGEAEASEFVAGAQKIVREHAAVYGELPEFEPGYYTFLADYVPWGGGDGMEHRNSTVVAAPMSFKRPGAVLDALDTVSHEFFHAWNVERIRPRTLEPFNFEEANMSGELWLAEGFTQYYGDLGMIRTGLASRESAAASLGRSANAVATSPGRQFRSAVGMSQMAPFTDAARAVDKTNFSITFLSYYTYGEGLALALDLSLRDRSNGKLSLDDFMRAMWRVHGKPGGPEPGLVAKPYTLKDARDRLAEVSGDRAFADQFFDKYVEGREAPDYARLFQRAGFILRKRSEDGWIGLAERGRGIATVSGEGTIASLIAWGTPAFEAGLDQGDVIVDVDGKSFASGALSAALKAHKPGDTISITYKRRNGATGTTKVTVKPDPDFDVVAIETTGGALTPEQKAFREAWLGSKVRN